MPPSRRPWRSAAWRGALWITLIALLTSGVALTLQYLQTARTLDAHREASLDDEASGLVERFRSDGEAGVAQAIQRQLAVPRIHEFFYLQSLADGTPVAGNLLAWPTQVVGAGFYRFETAVTNTRGDSSMRSVEVRAVVFDNGSHLLVGDFAEDRESLRSHYLSALTWTLLATGVLGMMFGWWYSRRGLGFVEQVSDAGQRFLAGAMDERLPVSSRGDEYDQLAVTINRTFAEVARLLGSLRAATDGMAHDLKTPLTRIRARLELAEMSEKGVQPLRQAAAETRGDLDSLLKLIDDMLSLARAEAAASDSFVPVALDLIVAEALELYEPLAADKGLALEASVEPLWLPGSRSLLGRLITNLLDNAIKFTPAGGRIDVVLERDGEHLLLTVADSGTGIAAERRDEMLGRFHQMDESRSTAGSGLGLSIVEAVARVHGATLKLSDNKPGLRVEVRFVW